MSQGKFFNLTLLVAALLFCCVGTVQAQDTPLKKHKRFTIGPKVEGNQLALKVSGVVAGKYEIYNSSEQYQGYRLGMFVKYSLKKSYLQGELSYFYNTAFVQFHNLKPDEDWGPGVGAVWDYSGPIYDFKQTDLAILGGYHLTSWLRLQTGAIIAYHFFENSLKYPDSIYQQYPMIKNDKILHDFPFSYNRWQLFGRAGIGVDFWKFTFDVAYDTSLTPISSEVQYNNQHYPLRQTASLWSVSLGFKLAKF